MSTPLESMADTATQQRSDDLRRAHIIYLAGWRWGLVCGLVAGACTSGLFALLVQAAWQAWACPTC